MPGTDFEPIFNELKTLLEPYREQMVLKADLPELFYLEAPNQGNFNKEVFFGSVKINKNYVSYHLMPVYIFPDLLNSLSPELKKRMQGKSCFNFSKLSQVDLDGLAEITRQGFERYRQAGLV